MNIREVFNTTFLKPLQQFKQNLALREAFNKPDFSSVLPPVPEAIRRQGKVKKPLDYLPKDYAEGVFKNSEAITNKFLSNRKAVDVFSDSSKTKPRDIQIKDLKTLFENILVQDPFSIKETVKDNPLELESVLSCSKAAEQALSLIKQYEGQEEMPYYIFRQLIDYYACIDGASVYPEERIQLAENYLNTAKELIEEGTDTSREKAQSLLDNVVRFTISSSIETYDRNEHLLANNKENDRYDWAFEDVGKQVKAHSTLWNDLEPFAAENNLTIPEEMKKHSNTWLGKLKNLVNPKVSV